MQVMPNYQNPIISHQTKNLIERLLLGKFSLSEIAKVTGISEQGLQKYFIENHYLLAS